MSRNNELKVSCAERLAFVLATTGMSQQELANRIGVTQSFISAVKRGESLLLVIGLCEQLGVSLDWYLRGKGEPFRGQTREQHIGGYPEEDRSVHEALAEVLEVNPEQRGRIEGYLDALRVVSLSRKHAQAG